MYYQEMWEAALLPDTDESATPNDTAGKADKEAQAWRYVVSGCLAGLSCRYDGGSKPCEAVRRLVEDGLAVTACPESLSGLPVPRPPCEQRDGRVVMRTGEDVTEAFERGAERAMRIVREHGCTAAILKARSPVLRLRGDL